MGKGMFCMEADLWERDRIWESFWFGMNRMCLERQGFEGDDAREGERQRRKGEERREREEVGRN